MSSLNKKAKEVVEKYDVSACTDVTGFGLLGHGAEMATASQVCLNLDVRKIPYFEDAKEYAKMGLICGSLQNRGHSGRYVDVGDTPEYYVDLLYDPQTSGGLLISVAPEQADAVMEDFEKKGLDTKVAMIGEVLEKDQEDNTFIRLV